MKNFKIILCNAKKNQYLYPFKKSTYLLLLHIFSTRIFFLEVCLYKQCIAMIHEKREKDLQNMSDFEANMKKI